MRSFLKGLNLKISHIRGPLCRDEDAGAEPDGAGDCRPHQRDYQARILLCNGRKEKSNILEVEEITLL